MWVCRSCFETNENDNDVCKHCEKKMDASRKEMTKTMRTSWIKTNKTQQTTSDFKVQPNEPIKEQRQADQEHKFDDRPITVSQQHEPDQAEPDQGEDKISYEYIYDTISQQHEPDQAEPDQGEDKISYAYTCDTVSQQHEPDQAEQDQGEDKTSYEYIYGTVDNDNQYVFDSSDFTPCSSGQFEDEPFYEEIGAGTLKLSSCLESIDRTDYMKELRVVMVAKTGSGQSATGNFLLGINHFVSKMGGQSVTQECSKDMIYKVLISFKSTSPYSNDNLDLKVGDNVLFIDKNDGWFWVRHGDDDGWIPSDHIQLISTNQTEESDSENDNMYEDVYNSDFEPIVLDQSDDEPDYQEISPDQSDDEPDFQEIGPGIFKLDSGLGSIDETEYQEQLRIVMVGKTGSGKSATGNSLLGRKHFVSKVGGQSVTKVCSRGETVYEGRNIVIIDTPGLFDTKLSPEQIRENIVSCIHMSLPGPHVFLLVLQIGRFTEEEIAALNHLFEIFGQSMGKCTIILFTGLDSLERENKTVQSYIEETGESIQKYIENCGSRYFAIDNVASPRRKENMRKNLFDRISEMVKQNNGNFFSNALFTNAENNINESLKEVKQKEEITYIEEVVKMKHDYDEKINVIKDDKEVLKQDLCRQDKRKQQLVQQREETEADICGLRYGFNISKEKQQVFSLKREELQKKKARIDKEESDVYESLHSLRIQQMELEDVYADIKNTQLTSILQVERDHKRRLSEAIEKATEESCKTMNSLWEKVEEVEIKLKEVNTQLDDERNRDNKQFRKLLATRQKNLTKQRHKMIRKQSKYFRQVMQKSAFLERELNGKRKMCIVM